MKDAKLNTQTEESKTVRMEPVKPETPEKQEKEIDYYTLQRVEPEEEEEQWWSYREPPENEETYVKEPEIEQKPPEKEPQMPPELIQKAKAITATAYSTRYSCLAPYQKGTKSYLADVIIDDYMHIIEERGHKMGKAIWALRPHYDGIQRETITAKALQKLTKRMPKEMRNKIQDIEHLDKIIIPVLLRKGGGHWILIVIDQTGDFPKTRLMDSAKVYAQTHNIDTEAIAKEAITAFYGNTELVPEGYMEMIEDLWEDEVNVVENSPQQDNGIDCGVHVCAQAGWTILADGEPQHLRMTNNKQAATFRYSMALDILEGKIHHTRTWDRRRWQLRDTHHNTGPHTNKRNRQQHTKPEEDPDTKTDEEEIIDLTQIMNKKTKTRERTITHKRAPHKDMDQWRNRTFLKATRTPQPQAKTRRKNHSALPKLQEDRDDLKEIEHTAANAVKEATEHDKEDTQIRRTLRNIMDLANIVSANPTHVREGDRWWSDEESHRTLGAETKNTTNITDFLKNTDTWIETDYDKPNRTKHMIKAAQQAAKTASAPTRIILTPHIERWEQIEQTIEKTTPPDDYAMENQVNHTQAQTQATTTRIATIKPQQNGGRTRVIIEIKNTQAEKRNILNAQNAETWPQKTFTITQDDDTITPKETPEPKTERYRRHLRPTMFWYRTDTPTPPTPALGNRKTKLEQAHQAMLNHNKILGMLGIMPKYMYKHLQAMGHPQLEDQEAKDILTEVSQILRKTTEKIATRHNRRLIERRQQTQREGIT
jgi:hypothetical protein